MLGIEDHEELLARLGRASSADVAHVVHTYRGVRRDPDGRTTEITIELLRGSTGFRVVARTDDGRRASPGEPTWDLAGAIGATDWSGLDAPVA